MVILNKPPKVPKRYLILFCLKDLFYSHIKRNGEMVCVNRPKCEHDTARAYLHNNYVCFIPHTGMGV